MFWSINNIFIGFYTYPARCLVFPFWDSVLCISFLSVFFVLLFMEGCFYVMWFQNSSYVFHRSVLNILYCLVVNVSVFNKRSDLLLQSLCVLFLIAWFLGLMVNLLLIYKFFTLLSAIGLCLRYDTFCDLRLWNMVLLIFIWRFSAL